MSQNEYDFMNNNKSKYRIYRVYEIYEKSNTLDIYKEPFDNIEFVKVDNISYKGKCI
jgi:hypothetical protein